MTGYRFAVSMKIKDGGAFFAPDPKSTVNFNSLFDLDRITGNIRRGELKVIKLVKRRVNNWKDKL
jgi:hypothetical protein